ncbi:MAG: hypothetical protein HOO67_05760 [Candidatus Peribacteraceae bacterium]|nr:hypothetical protein [Candidatus Peribacteraceae bacterium]
MSLNVVTGKEFPALLEPSINLTLTENELSKLLGKNVLSAEGDVRTDVSNQGVLLRVIQENRAGERNYIHVPISEQSGEFRVPRPTGSDYGFILSAKNPQTLSVQTSKKESILGATVQSEGLPALRFERAPWKQLAPKNAGDRNLMMRQAPKPIKSDALNFGLFVVVFEGEGTPDGTLADLRRFHAELSAAGDFPHTMGMEHFAAAIPENLTNVRATKPIAVFHIKYT